MLEFLIYYVDYVKPEMIDHYAAFLEIKPEKLKGYLNQAEEILRKKNNRRKAIMQKKRSYYIELKYQEMKLRITEENKERQDILDKITVMKKKVENLKYRAKRIRMSPTTIEVAKIAGSAPSTTGRDIKYIRQYILSNNQIGKNYGDAITDLLPLIP